MNANNKPRSDKKSSRMTYCRLIIDGKTVEPVDGYSLIFVSETGCPTLQFKGENVTGAWAAAIFAGGNFPCS